MKKILVLVMSIFVGVLLCACASTSGDSEYANENDSDNLGVKTSIEDYLVGVWIGDIYDTANEIRSELMSGEFDYEAATCICFTNDGYMIPLESVYCYAYGFNPEAISVSVLQHILCDLYELDKEDDTIKDIECLEDAYSNNYIGKYSCTGNVLTIKWAEADSVDYKVCRDDNYLKMITDEDTLYFHKLSAFSTYDWKNLIGTWTATDENDNAKLVQLHDNLTGVFDGDAITWSLMDHELTLSNGISKNRYQICMIDSDTFLSFDYWGWYYGENLFGTIDLWNRS